VNIAVVIPAYNEAATIRDVALRALHQLPTVYVVDDGSSDGTSAQVSDIGVHCIRNAGNCGKGGAIVAGAEAALAAGASGVITLDGDGQHAPEDIPGLLAAADRVPSAIVIGARVRNRDRAPPARRMANAIADFWVSWAAGLRIQDTQSGFRYYPASVFDLPVGHGRSAGFVFESEVLIEAVRHGHGCICVPIDTVYPKQARASHFRPFKDISRIVVMVAGKLLKWGLYPLGLARTLFGKRGA